MAKKTAALLPPTSEILRQFGERLRLARRRRGLTAKNVGERAGMAPMTLRSLERGEAGVTIGAYLSVMQVLGLEGDLEVLAAADPVGRSLQDARLNSRIKSTARAKTAPEAATVQSPQSPQLPQSARPTPQMQAMPLQQASSWVREQPTANSAIGEPVSGARALIEARKNLPSLESARSWIEKSGFASSRALVNLIIIPIARKGR